MAHSDIILPDALEPLKEQRRWVAWALEGRDGGRKTKKPYNPATGKLAKPNDPGTWGTYAEAATAVRARGLAGVGVMLGDGLAGIDLDHVIDANGRLDAAAARIVQQMGTYTELSPSGNGLHILCHTTAAAAEGRRCSSVFTAETETPGAEIELYMGGRYFTVTGDVYGEPAPIEDRTEALDKLRAHYWPPRPVGEPVAPRTRTVSASDAEVLDKLRMHNARAAALYDAGDLTGYNGDHSAADLALCAHLIYWTDGDIVQADRLFRCSALMRDKWDETHFSSGETYGQHTLAKALSAYMDAASMRRQAGRRPAPDDVLRALDTNGPRALYLPRIGRTQAEYTARDYARDIACLARHRDAKTGFDGIDAQHPFYPGLYVLGAASSLGKTSFALQLADQVAEGGRDVIYISLEQTAAELTAKSVARYAYRLRTGCTTILTDQALDVYRDTAARHLCIVPGGFRTRAHDVISRVREWLGEHNGAAPVIIVDYLQALAPLDPRQTERQAIDDALGELKDFQCEHDLTMLLISSLNRANYMVPVSFESFKESGGIEYTADVVWGLDLACLQDDREAQDHQTGTSRHTARDRAAVPEKPFWRQQLHRGAVL